MDANLELQATIGSSDKPQRFPRLSSHAILRLRCPVAVAVVFAFCPVLVAATRDLGDVSNQAPL